MPTEKINLTKIAKQIMALEGKGAFTEADGSISVNGLNQKTFDSYNKNNGLPFKDVREATFGDYLDIIDNEFINRNGINEIPEKFIPLVVDRSFNSGPAMAAKLFQKTVGAEEDGIIGPKTLEKMEKFFEKEGNDDEKFINNFTENSIQFIMDSNSEGVVNNRDGLLNRIEKVRLRELGSLSKTPVNE